MSITTDVLTLVEVYIFHEETVFYKMYFSEDGDTAEVAPTQGQIQQQQIISHFSS
jgi:hypothetical protein